MDSPPDHGTAVPENTSDFEPSFRDVLAGAKRGDGSSFERIFRALNQRLHAFTRARGALDPEGTVNDVFLKMFTNISTFDGSEVQFRAWMFAIARNQLIDESRRSSRRPAESLTDEIVDFQAGDVEVDVFDRLGNDWLIKQLEQLTEEQRDVLLLRIVSDLTVDAVANLIGKEPGAVKALQRRALRTLERHISKEPHPYER